MSPYCDCSILVEVCANDGVTRDDVETQLREELFFQNLRRFWRKSLYRDMLSVKLEANHRLWMITYWTEIHSGEGTRRRQRTDRRSVMILIHLRNGIKLVTMLVDII